MFAPKESYVAILICFVTCAIHLGSNGINFVSFNAYKHYKGFFARRGYLLQLYSNSSSILLVVNIIKCLYYTNYIYTYILIFIMIMNELNFIGSTKKLKTYIIK